MSNITGRKREMRYILIFNPKNKEKPRESMEPLENSIPKIGRKISSLKGPKERCSKKQQTKKIDSK